MTIVIMPRSKRQTYTTLTEALRAALADEESLRAVERQTGVQMASLVRFTKGQRSLRLDKADILCRFFGMEIRRRRGR